ncbi:hypothetical protein NW817_03085 [Synechococcus sp. H65.1]|uniref:hypothetical protein n=2 Tax=unclassified Synechococcus TaxID=2626047 RepID=UPI0039C4C422
MDIRKPLYVHIVTTLTAASIAALPQSDLGRALRVALVVGAGNAVASRVAWSSARDRDRRVQSLQAEIEELQDQSARKEERWQGLVGDLSRQVQAREEELQNRQAELTELQTQLQQSSKQVQDLEAQLVEQRRLQEELRRREHRIEELCRQIEEGEKELSRLRDQLRQKSEQLQELEAQLAERRQLLQQLQDKDRQVRSLQAEIERLRAEQFHAGADEIRELRLQLQQRDEEIKTLKTGIEGYEKTLSTILQGRGHYTRYEPSEIDIVLKITEKEFYPQEAKSFILEILREKINNVHEGSRVQHILRNLVENNEANEGDDHRRRIRESVDSLSSDYNGWSDYYRKRLEELGFEVIAEDNHVRICFHGDRRYQISLSKTPSDREAGHSISRDIRNTIFGL